MKAEHETATDAAPAQEAVTPQPGPGNRLAKARIAANKSVEEVATSLNLTVGVVEALERDADGDLPAPVFVRGYIKNYARLVGLNGDELVNQYEQLRAPEVPLELRPRPASETARIRSGIPLRAVFTTFVVVAAGLAAWWWWAEGGRFDIDDLTGGGEASTASVPAAPVLPDVVVITEPAPGTTDPEPSRAAVADQAPQPVPASDAAGETGADLASDEVASPPVPPEPAPEPEPPAPTGHELSLSLSDDVWVEVVDGDGSRLVFDMLRAGTRREVTGEGPFLVLLGKSGAVDVKLDGRDVDHAAFENKGIARFVLDDLDGEIVTRNP